MKKFSTTVREAANPDGHIENRPGFIVRIELHGVKDTNDYKELRQYLKEDEFQEFVIAAEDNKPFALPRATYFYPSPALPTQLGASDVHKKAAEAVKEALLKEPLKTKLENKEATIIVAKSQTVYWTGLKPYEPEAGL